MWRPDPSYNNYSVPGSWLYASRRWSAVPENVGTVPDISGSGFSVSLFHGQKRYAVLYSSVPETDRSSEDPVFLFLPLQKNSVDTPGSEELRLPVLSGTFLFPISLRIFSRQRYICLRMPPALSHQ